MDTLMHLSWQQILMRLTLVPVLVASVIGVLRFHRLPNNLRYLAAGVAFFLFPMGLLGLAMMMMKRNNLFLMPIYTVGELLILGLVYHATMRSRRFTWLVVALVTGFVAYLLYDSQAGPSPDRFRPGQQVIQGLMVLLMVGLYFRRLLHDLQVRRLWEEPMFWVSVGLCIYFAAYLQIALFSNYLLRYSKQLNMNIWTVHSLLFIVLYLCYCRALWLPPKK
ncbi:hypothetical protein [Hymenobacter psychrophilus]|uniref:YhhN-like protein n=1 Tax=Hymenobacter psychrophilus TaxID=651662 RepID=A0A1H3DJB0_9BACT|nr:hypothetical protein [Hymenobacter psychrophilus]SDX66437.1 hypothetical protein SAMN04488069_102382 [Hymenobacter psychrophilus]